MTMLANRRLIRLLAGVALPLAVGLLLTPTGARASCGDYVTRGSDSSHDDHPKPVVSTVRQDAPSSSQPVPPPSPQPDRRPCPGPTCSQNPTPLPLASAPQAPERSRESPCTALPTFGSLFPPCYQLAEGGIVSVVRPVSEIYHPPR
jgi:hypothetical protein